MPGDTLGYVPDTPIILGFDPATLRERIDTDAAQARLAEIGRYRSLTALNERVTLLRLLDRLDEAFEVAQMALRQSRFTGSREDSLAARIRRAQVMHAQGKLEPALHELTGCVEEAVAHEWAPLAGFALQQRGKVRFELGDFQEALDDFERAAAYRQADGVPQDQERASRYAVRVARARLEGGDAPADDEEPIRSIDV